MKTQSVLFLLISTLLISCAHDPDPISEEPLSLAPPSGTYFTPGQCSDTLSCTAVGAVVAGAAIAKANTPQKDPFAGASDTSLLIICNQIINENGMEVACPRSKLVITFDSETKLELVRHGEDILIPGLAPRKPVDISISIRGCTKAKTLNGVYPGGRYEVLFPFPCDESRIGP